MMLRLLLIICMALHFGLSCGEGSNSNADATSKDSADKTDSVDKSKSSTIFKGFFSSDDDKGEGERVKKRVLEKNIIDTDQLQSMIDKLPEKDKNTLSAIKTQIATWPPIVFEEISAYREFVINSRKIAQQKYESLSAEAKSALESEKQLKAQLSPQTIQTLEALDVTASKTN